MRLCVLVLLSVWVVTPSVALAVDDPVDLPDEPAGAPERGDQLDSDGDGLPDELELRTGTSPYDADTDGDGVPDGVEDKNRDGVVDPGESDPRRPGLFPGASPHIPEPLFFDLVRGLGARKGELEVNTLFGLSRRADGRATLEWAPEVEWAIVDGFAVEFELPMVDRHLEAYKVALQWTAPSFAADVAHGFQLLGEYLIDSRISEISLLYLLGGRTGRTSLFAMVGPRIDAGVDIEPLVQVNPSIFVDLNEAVTLGIEGNALLGKQGGPRTQAIAQMHWQVSHTFRVQVGAGVRGEPGRTHPVGVARLILE